MNIARKMSLKIERLTDAQFSYIILAIPILFIIVLDFWPILWTFDMSFHANSQGAELIGEFVGLKLYSQIINGKAFLTYPFFDSKHLLSSSVGLTVVIAIATVILSMLLGFGEALVMNKQFRGRSIARVVFLLPWAVPTAILGMMFYLLFSPSIGVGTDWLKILGFSHYNAPLAHTVEGLAVVITAESWKQSAFVAIIILSGLQSVDRDLYKVSRVNGATAWQQFKTVTFPIILPIVAVALLFRTITGMRVYGPVVFTTRCNTVPVLTCSIIDQFKNHQYGYSSALSGLLAVMIGLILLIYVGIYFFREVSFNE